MLNIFYVDFSADELVITELLFNNVFRDLTPQQCCALLSCLVFDEKANEMPKLTEELSGPLRQLQVIPRWFTAYLHTDIASPRQLVRMAIFLPTAFPLNHH